MYPIVPGHELAGVVTEVGANVTRVNVGSLVALGCTKDSCMECDMCDDGEENYCRKGEMKVILLGFKTTHNFANIKPDCGSRILTFSRQSYFRMFYTTISHVLL